MGSNVPAHILGYDYSLEALIWKGSKISNDIEFYREVKTIIVVDIWLNSLCL